MRYSLITQIALIGLALTVFFTVGKPMFASITLIQDDTLKYKDAIANAQQFNDALARLVATRDAFSEQNLERLQKLLPTKIDAPKIMRDIEAIFLIKSVPITSLSALETSEYRAYVQEDGSVPATAPVPLDSQDFEITFSGTYDDLKAVLSLIELNETLLEVTSLQFGSSVKDSKTAGAAKLESDTGEFNFTLVLRAYGLLDSPSSLE